VAGLERGVELTHAVPLLGDLLGVDCLVGAADQRCERTVVAVGIDPVDALVLDSADARTEAQAQHGEGGEELAEWCRAAGRNAQPRKSDQDKLDSALCVLIALHWRLCPREESLLLGDLTTGYMVLPASQEVRKYLCIPARKHLVAMDDTTPY
jgi:hypothetical protein